MLWKKICISKVSRAFQCLILNFIPFWLKPYIFFSLILFSGLMYPREPTSKAITSALMSCSKLEYLFCLYSCCFSIFVSKGTVSSKICTFFWLPLFLVVLCLHIQIFSLQDLHKSQIYFCRWYHIRNSGYYRDAR